MDNVLITGGTGLLGSRLTELLLQSGYSVTYLSRSGGKEGDIRKFAWEPSEGKMDLDALLDVDYIVNLAGAGVFDHKWNKEYKEEIVASRVNATHLIYEKLKGRSKWPKAFVTASAIGYYGADTGERLNTEESPVGEDFLAGVCRQWETAANYVESLGIRTVKIRIGIVLSKKGGALEKLEATVKRGAGAVLGSGKQFVSWIHIDDLCRLFIKALKDESMGGIYNGVAPNPVTNEELTKALGEVLHKPIILPSVPAFALKLMLGAERAETILGSSKVSPAKALKAGFKFEYEELKSALSSLYEARA
jgi:uncharacterized protein (TIGR01777 family)